MVVSFPPDYRSQILARAQSRRTRVFGKRDYVRVWTNVRLRARNHGAKITLHALIRRDLLVSCNSHNSHLLGLR